MLRPTLLAATAVLAVACHGNDPATRGAAPPPADTKPAAKGAPAGPPPPGGHDFTPEARALLSVGACADVAPPPGFDPRLLTGHCEIIKEAQTNYLAQWVRPARSFFVEHVPSDVPKKVVYPFAGGDLSTALTVFPDADEITTISLEPAGDPRDLTTLKAGELDRALKKVENELKFLYRVNFSNTLNMIDAMREGVLPTQLIFGLSALKIHGYELVALRYFRLEDNGGIHYLDDSDLKKAPDPEKGSAEQRNFVFSNCEVQFRKSGGRIQVWRHMRHNLGDDTMKGIGPGLKEDPRIVKH